MPTTTTKYKPIYLIHLYRLARAGLTDRAIAQALGLHYNSILKWKRGKPEVEEAMRLARQESTEADDFATFCYRRLGPELREVWDRLMAWEHEDGGAAKISQMLADHGTRTRQHMYLHALVHSHFSPARAAGRVGVDRSTVRHWLATDPDFALLVQEVADAKGDWYEESLVKLVEKGDAAATVFVNRTYNRKRGYGVVSQVEVAGSVDHNVSHQALDLEEVLQGVSASCRLEVLAALRKYQDRSLRRPPPAEQVVLEHISQDIADNPQAG